MKCFIVFYFVTMLFVFGMCSSQYCTFEETNGTISPDGEVAMCGTPHTKHTLDFIPPIPGFILRIHMFNQKIVELPYNAFQNLCSQYNVSTISLIDCKVRDIDADAFLNLYNLTSLSLKGNDIHYVDGKTFQHVTKLTEIYLYDNKIEVLPKGLFDNLPLLNIVDLSSNQIRHIETDTFGNSPLFALSLNRNKLQYLDVSVKNSVSNKTFLILDHNPWRCDCNFIDLYDFYMGLEIVKFQEMNSIAICDNPPAVQGMRWPDLTRDQFICDPRIEILLNETTVIPIGQSVRLPCVVYDHDKPVITWRKESTSIATDYLSSSSYKNKHFLNYTFDFEETDAGVYYCNAEFADGRVEANITLKVYNRTKNQLLDTTEFADVQQDYNTTLGVYIGTKNQQDDTGLPQPFSNSYTILFLVLVCVVAIIIGIIFVVRYALAKSNRRRHFWLPTVVKRRSFRQTNTHRMDNAILMNVVQSRTVSKNSDSGSSTDD